MSVKTVRYRGNLGSANTDRNPSPNVWGDCPWPGIQEGEISGLAFWDDFEGFNKTPATTEGNWSGEKGYAQFGSTGGFITAGTGQGGEIVIGSDDDNEGIGIRTLATPFKLTRALGQFWFEARVKTSTIANTTLEWFIGLMEDTALTATVPITSTAATLADKNLVGFYRTESAGSVVNTTYKADGITAVTVQASAGTLVADTYMKLGIRFQPNLDPDSELVSSGVPVKTNVLSFYVNGIRCTTSKNIPSAAGTDFPNDIALGLVLATRNAAGTSPGSMTIDWWRAAQLI